MPAQIFLTREQVHAIAELEEAVVITEGPAQPGANTLDVWVMDSESMSSNTHRSVVIDPQGDIIGDQRLGDNE